MSDTISFTGNSITTGFNITGYEWLFDDNSTATTVNTTKHFLTAGPHDVRYRIIADNGCIDDTIRTVNILDQPVAKFGVDASICLGDSVYITDTSTVANGNITSWHWDFGDGNTETRNNGNPFYHTYVSAGPFTIKLVVSSGNGCSSDTLPKQVTVLPKPAASFTYDRDVCLGQSIQFTNTSTPVSGTITAWNWNFGDGNTATYNNGNPFSYTYTSVNSYIVTLTVQGSNGCESEVFRDTVNVTSKPSAAFSYAGKACVDSNFIFTSATTYNASVPSNWYWEFGDGQTTNIITGNTASHNYAVPLTNVRVRHSVSYGGCPSDTTEQTIPLVSANPTATFNATAAALCEGMPVQISGSGSADISSWNWNMGNGTSTAVPPFTHIYNAAGNYAISLTVQNAAGCQSVVAPQSITIAVKPAVDAGPDIYKREAESKTLLASSNSAGYDFLWSPGTNLSATNILTPVTSSPVDIMYRVTATDRTSGCIATDSMFVKIITTIYVPNAFTPNGDGLNDAWRIPALAGYPNAVVTIFNRYSQKIFESKGYTTPWDGRFKGQEQPIGAYIYVINPGEPEMKPIKGTVMIIR